MTEEQQLAIDKQYGNILVSASAGSGKTTVLVERVINKVINHSTDIDKLLIVTFTNASATELKERLLNAIYKALESNPTNQFLRRQLININRASINTIHAFCLEVIRSNFYLTDIDPNFTVCDDTQSSILKNKAMENILESEYVDSSNNLDTSKELYKVLELFNGKDDKFTETMFKMYSYIQSFAYPFDWLKTQIEKYNIIDSSKDLYEFDFGQEIYDSCIDNLVVISKKLNGYKELFEYESDNEKFIELIDSDTQMIDRCINNSENSWDKLYLNLSLVDLSLYSMPRTKFSNTELKEEFHKFRNIYLKSTMKKMQESIYAKSEDIIQELLGAYEYLNYFYNFLIKFDTEYAKLKKDSNYIDFNDIEHLALKLLVKNESNKLEYTEVALKYQEKFSEVYIDEYQDTSFVQEAILSAVSGNKNRFMVGDIKQSIYKFRQAMPQIFNEKYEKYDLLEKLDNSSDNVSDSSNCHKIILAKNFRSRRNILNSINYIFSQIMSKDLGECDYSGLEELKYGAEYYSYDENSNYSTEVNMLNMVENEESINNEEIEETSIEANEYVKELKKFEIEAKYIARRISDMVEEKQIQVFDSNKKENREITYKDIVILLRGIKDKGNIIEDALKEYKIPVFSDANNSLFDSDEVSLVLSFLQVIDNPLQDIPLVSIMYSVIGKFSLDELSIICKNKKDYLYSSLTECLNNKDIDSNLIEKISKFLTLIDEFRSYAKIYKISDLIILLYQKTNIYYEFSCVENSKNAKANLDYLIELAINFESNTSDINNSIYSYISYIDKLKDRAFKDSGVAKIIGENENVVRVMTIHKSKGLEFPVVILCDTNTRYNYKDMSENIIMNHNIGIGINSVNEELGIAYPSVIKQGVKSISIKETKSEELRMLYVALTRAREKLIIYSSVSNYEKLYKDLFVMYNENGSISPISVEQNDTYFKNILMALKKYINNKEKEIFNINITNVYDKDQVEHIYNSAGRLNESNISLEEKYKNMSSVFNDKIYFDKNIYELVNNNINYNYPNTQDTSTKTRVSVSELKKQEQEEYVTNYFSNNEQSNKLSFKKPLCIDETEKSYTSVRKGILIHFILEHLDFKEIDTKEEIEKYIDELLNKGVISQNDVSQINLDSILVFLNSKIGKELKIIESNNIKKEEEFILKNKGISNSTIQGVIDLYYIKQNNMITLVDFKTDRLRDEAEYIDRYKKQLEIYKEAINTLTKYKVDETYIYSFYLGKEIRI